MTDQEQTGLNREIPDDASYEELVRRLEESVTRLETGQLSLEDAVLEYEYGMTLIQRCNQMLDQAELRVTELSERTQDLENNEDSWR